MGFIAWYGIDCDEVQSSKILEKETAKIIRGKKQVASYLPFSYVRLRLVAERK